MKVIFRSLAALVALALFPISFLAQTTFPGAAVDAVVQKTMTQLNIPGAQLAIIDHGQVVYTKGYGFADLAKQQPVTLETRFEIGSVTKQFTAAAILQLRAEGKLALSDRLGKYVPQYRSAKDVTIEQLLWQVSGIPEYLDSDAIVKRASATPGGFDTILALVKNKPLDFKSGSKWAYSNTNYILLGHIVELASHTDWETYVRKYIFAPAGMTDSDFITDESHLTPMALGYVNGKSGPVPAPILRGAWAFSAGEIVSTVADLVRWDAAFYGGKIVSLADVKLATSVGTLNSGAATQYGFGWIDDTFDGQARIWHNGGTFGFGAQNDVYPKLGQSIIVLVNSASRPPSAIADAAFEAIHPDFAAAALKPVAGEDPKITALAKQWVKRVQTGTVDRTQLTAEMSKALTPVLVKNVAAQFGALGPLTSIAYRSKKVVNGITVYTYALAFGPSKLTLTIGLDGTGKIAEIFFGE